MLAKTVILTLLYLSSLCVSACHVRPVLISSKEPIQAQIQIEDAKYIISSHVDLKGEIVYLPKGATVHFKKRGLLKNGTVVADSAQIIFSKSVNFEDCAFSGKFCNSGCDLKNFGKNDQEALVSVLSFANSCISKCQITITRDVVIKNILPIITNEVSIDAKGHTIQVPSGCDFPSDLGQNCAIFRLEGGGSVKNMKFRNEGNYQSSLFNIKNGDFLFDNIECKSNGYFGTAIFAPMQNCINRCTINNIHLTDMGVSGRENGFLQFGIYVCASKEVYIKNGYISGSGWDGAILMSEHVTVDHLTSNNNGVDKVTKPGVAGLYVCSRILGSIKDVSVCNCTFIGNNGHGLDVARNASAYPYKGEELQNIIIKNCVCSNSGLSGISIEGAENVSIHNCTLSNNGNNTFGGSKCAGINIQRIFQEGTPMNSYVIENNIFEDSKDCQLYDILISGSPKVADYQEGVVVLNNNIFARRNIKNSRHLKNIKGQEVVYE